MWTIIKSLNDCAWEWAPQRHHSTIRRRTKYKEKMWRSRKKTHYDNILESAFCTFIFISLVVLAKQNISPRNSYGYRVTQIYINVHRTHETKKKKQKRCCECVTRQAIMYFNSSFWSLYWRWWVSKKYGNYTTFSRCSIFSHISYCLMILLLLFLFLLSIIVKHTIYSQVHVFCISPVNLCRCSLFGWLLVVVAFSPFDYCIVIDHKSTNIYSKCTLMTSCASTPHIQSLACWQTPFSLSILFRRHFCYEIECSVLRVYTWCVLNLRMVNKFTYRQFGTVCITI